MTAREGQRTHRHLATFAVWALALNLPAVGFQMPFNQLWSTTAFLVWATIPGWLSGRCVGARHFADSDVGVVPATLLAWSLAVGFWILVALGLTLVSVVRHRGPTGGNRRGTGNQETPNK